uniref:Uncharacterized protein n=1 Tax=Physcomitrium patens TaxID=3218 RepID=A9RKG2_PHYPA|nr:hypothetical protein PHYPA_009215 [Physcomitrium patens]
MIFLGKEGVPSRCPGDASAIQGSMSARDCHGLIHALPSQEKQRRQPTGGFRSVASGLRGKLQLQTRQRGLHDNPCMVRQNLLLTLNSNLLPRAGASDGHKMKLHCLRGIGFSYDDESDISVSSMDPTYIVPEWSFQIRDGIRRVFLIRISVGGLGSNA